MLSPFCPASTRGTREKSFLPPVRGAHSGSVGREAGGRLIVICGAIVVGPALMAASSAGGIGIGMLSIVCVCRCV